MSEPLNFSDIAPVDDSNFHDNMARMVKEPGLEHAVKYVLPDVDYPEFVRTLLNIRDKATFQHQIMWPFMEMMAKKTTSGVSISGIENLNRETPYTFITNHRDIVLDASFLNICFFRNGRQASEVAIGSNLLIFDWIATLVKLNGCFVVKRDLPRLEALTAARELSAYIHYAIQDKRRSVWIAQRQGRAKDSSDTTQGSLIKMLSLAGGGSTRQNLMAINLCPVSIAYEYDPNDYLKAREFLLKKRDPEFKKSMRDDLFSMETGLLQFKGRVHFAVGKCLNERLSRLPVDIDRSTLLEQVCRWIDHWIHTGYKIYAINYIAHDRLTGRRTFEMLYTERESNAFEEYITHQLQKVEIPDLSDEDYAYMRRMMYTMYANPLINKLRAEQEPE